MTAARWFGRIVVPVAVLATAGLRCDDDGGYSYPDGGDADGAVEGGADADADADADAEADANAEADADAEVAGAPWDLTFSGTGFAPHEGQELSAALVDVSTDAVVATDSAVVTGGAFSFIWAGALAEGGTYRIDYYADFNGNGTCDAPPQDHVWSVAVPAFTGDTTVDVTHNTDFVAAACASF